MSLNEYKTSVINTTFCSNTTLNNNNPLTKYNMLSKYFGSSCINMKADGDSHVNQPSSYSARKMNDSTTTHHRHHNHHHYNHHHHWNSTCTNQNSTNTNTWSSITYNTLKPIPEYYPLSISHVIIENKTLNNIISKIKECLQKCSIATAFDDKKVRIKYVSSLSYYAQVDESFLQAIAWCESEDHVRFTIRLFASNENKHEYNEGKAILVEIQRFDGCE